MFDKQTDVMRAPDSLQQRGTILRKLTRPLCITIRKMAPMDVGGIFDLFENNKFDFQVERSPPFALSLATFSLFESGLYGSRKLPCGTISLCFHMHFYHPVCDASFENRISIQG